LRNSPSASDRGCGGTDEFPAGRRLAVTARVLLLLALSLPPWLCAAPPAKAPLLVLLGGDTKTWQAWCQQRGWQFLEAWSQSPEKNFDLRVKELAGKVDDALKRLPVDENRVYLAGQGDGASAVFYVANRIPDMWAAAVAAGGSPRAAIDSNRVYAANTTNLPVLWLFGEKSEEPLGQRLKSAGFNLEWREQPAAKPAEIFDWLAAHQRDPYPTTADCETGTPLFARCYWVEMTRFDPGERNDVLDSTRVPPIGSGAGLALGPFGYDPAAPGPGLEVTWLPDKYDGPLKLKDRIVALGGKELKDGREFEQLMYQTFDEKPVVVMVQRGERRIRVETRIVVPRREETVTARVQARYLPDLREVQVVSRTVTQMKLTLPEAWLPAAINWNGTEVAKAETAGCWLLDEQKELLTAKRCP
jgi:predicted esterase